MSNLEEKAASVTASSDSKLIIQVDLSAWRVQQLCPHCHLTPRRLSRILRKKDDPEYEKYVQLANAHFGDRSLPLCHNCWDNLEHYNKCRECQVPLELTNEELSDFGRQVLRLTTIFEKDDLNGDFCIACCEKHIK